MSNRKEIWMDTLGWKGYYQFSTLGRLRSLDRVIRTKASATRGRQTRHLRGKIINTGNGANAANPKLYPFAILSGRNKKEKIDIHIGVWEAKHRRRVRLNKVINHQDLNRKNCELLNLEEITQVKNVEHSVLHYHKDKLPLVRQIIKRFQKGHSYSRIAYDLNIKYAFVSRCIRGKLILAKIVFAELGIVKIDTSGRRADFHAPAGSMRKKTKRKSAKRPPGNWRWIPGWEGFYKASEAGQIWSEERLLKDGRRIGGRLLKGRLDPAGYRRVTLFRNGPKIEIGVSHLIEKTFHGPFPNHWEVDHLNRKRDDNRACNLKAKTSAGNMANAGPSISTAFGYTEAIVEEALDLLHDGHHSPDDVARKFGTRRTSIMQWARRETEQAKAVLKKKTKKYHKTILQNITHAAAGRRRATANYIEFVETIFQKLGPRQTITRQELNSLVAKGFVTLPFWLISNKDCRVSRGVYDLTRVPELKEFFSKRPQRKAA